MDVDVYSMDDNLHPHDLKHEMVGERDFDPRRVARARLPLRWYNARMHAAAFALPEFLRRAVAR